jgi:hypothetical protein
MMDNTFSNLDINGMNILNSENEIIFEQVFRFRKTI